MRLLWSARFELGLGELPGLLQVLGGWLSAPRREPTFEAPLVPGDFSFPTGGRLQVDQEPVQGAPDYWAMRYERPVHVQGLAWTTDFCLRRGPDAFDGFARLYQQSLAAGLPRFQRVVLRPPSFMWELRARDLLGPGLFLVRSVGEGQVDEFVQSVFDPQRISPIVAVSVEPFGEKPLVDPVMLQDELVGIAQVLLLDKAASRALPLAFGRRGTAPSLVKLWSVYGGAVRVYRAGAALSESPFNHPLHMPGDVAKAEFAPNLKDWCWSLATLDAPPDVPDVTFIRKRREPVLASAAAAAKTLEEASGVYQTLLSQEEERTKEETRRAEQAEDRAQELVDRVRELESTVQALKYQLARKGEVVTTAPGETEVVAGDAEAAVESARQHFAGTLLIPNNVAIDTAQDAEFWYPVLRALHQLCEQERRGEVKNKREVLRSLLNAAVGLPKDTYKRDDTGVYIHNPETGTDVHLRDRVHLYEGKPAETESVYWATIGDVQTSYRYLVGRIGRHP